MLSLLDKITGRLSEWLHVIAAVWMFAIATMIFIDVFFRGVLNLPVLGVAEIIGNSVVAIAFLQLAYTVRVKGMLRAQIIDTIAGPNVARVSVVIGLLAGALFFFLIAWGSWSPMVRSIASLEYEGEGGSVVVPVYPLRILIVVGSFLGGLNFLLLALRELGGLPPADTNRNGTMREKLAPLANPQERA